MQQLAEAPATPAAPAGGAPVAQAPLARRLGLDRFTLAIAAGVALLIPLLFAIVLAQPRQAQPLDESRPAGVAHNYYLALSQGDLARAYGYLSAEARTTISYEQFAARVTETPERRGIRIDDERIEDGTGRVTVRTTYAVPGGPFPFMSGERSVQRTVVLRREDGSWKIAPPQPFYGPYGPYDPYDWYRW
jgi:hypothetical protein